MKFIILALISFNSFSLNKRFLLHSGYNKDNFFMFGKSDRNILFVNSKCRECFLKLDEILSLNGGSSPLIFTNTFDMFGLDVFIKKNKLSKKVVSRLYQDPGGRLTKHLKLENEKSSFIRYEAEKFKYKSNVDITKKIKNPYKSGVWR